ncbi:hypothetical protein DV738_g3614, partial [Chaetothyriales sp. CBS 135597]
MGGIATITMSLLLPFSFMWFRVKSYEIFLIIHIILSVLTLVGLYYHTVIFDGEYDPYLWAPIGIWCIDRGTRFVRWVYCNVHVNSSGILNTKASATYIRDGNFLRVEIVPGSHVLKPGPGQHYYLYQPVSWRGWENHPFTLAGYGKIEASSQHDRHSVFHDAVGQQKLTFFVRPFDGWTKRLRDQCLKSATGTITPHIFIEGPYGENSSLHTYENIIFIVGGSGIAGALPYLQEYLRMKAENTTLTRDITLVWSARQASMIRDIAENELKPMIGRDDIHLQFHATVGRGLRLKDRLRGKGSEKEVSTSSSSSSDDELEIASGRPNIRHSILNMIKEVNNAGSAGGRIAIMTCGPGAMADEARAAVHAALKQGQRGVEYFEEAFGW